MFHFYSDHQSAIPTVLFPGSLLQTSLATADCVLNLISIAFPTSTVLGSAVRLDFFSLVRKRKFLRKR